MNGREEETRELVLQLEIAEAEARRKKVTGRSYVRSTATDEQLALQLHLEELQRSRQVLGDDRFAHSVTDAIDSDANIIARYQEVDKMERADRAMAMNLSNSQATDKGYRTLSSVSRSSKKTKERMYVAAK
jgi:hypothetical protein